ncbi:MAG TPA: hypothetical protein VIM51_10915 [Desulfosporosinus sp.]
MTYTTTISRGKLRLKEYDSDSVVVTDSESSQQITEKEFYFPAVELLALIYPEVISSRID